MASSPATTEPRRPGKHDAAVADKLAAAARRIRALEVTVGVCGVLVGFLVYGQVMAVLDMRFQFPDVVRQLGLLLFLGAVGTWGYYTIYRPLRYGINPYYAARVIEDNAAGSHNGVLNWLDSQDAPDATMARPLIGQRAAREAAKADLEKAIDGEAATWTAAAAALLFLFAFILALLVGPRGFLESLGRVFFPATWGLASQAPTGITILRPDGGDGTILVGQAATVTVKLDGRIPKPTDPDAAKIRYRHGSDEPWRERLLDPREAADTWEVVLPPTEVENGIDYEVTAGGTTTPTHRITVIAAPMIEDFRATYHFRDYTGRTFEVRRDRRIDSLQGTEVTLLVKTNRTLTADSPRLEIVGQETIKGAVLKDDPTAFEVKLTLQSSGQYRLHFASTRNDTYADAHSYEINVRPDEKPEVELTHPARDVQLAANGFLTLEGWATDKEGVKNLTLRLSVIDGPKLKPVVYRGMETFRQKHKTYPTYVKYRDRLDLANLRDEAGRPFKPEVGQKIEYFLEAADACDLPGSSRVVASKKYRVEVVEADPDGKGQQEQRQQDDKAQQDHNKQQDEAHAQEDNARKDENDKGEKGGENKDGGQQPGDQGEQGNNPNNQGQQGNNPNPDDKQTLDDAERLKDALNKQEQKNQPGQGKEQGNDQKGGESKEGGENKDGENDKSESKDGATGEKKDQAGQGKEQGKEGGAGEQKAEGKEGGQGEAKPEGKQGGQQGGMNQGQAGEGKPGEQQGENKPGQGRERKEGQGQGTPSERKERSDAAGKEGAATAKDAGGQGREAAGERKDAPTNPQPGEGKEGGQPSQMAAPPTGNPTPGQGESKQGEQQPNPMNPQQPGPTQGATSKPGGPKRDLNDPREARPEDVEALKNQAGDPTDARSEAAGKELERIEKEARDPKARQAAKQAREQLNNPPGENKPAGGPGMGGMDMGPAGGENKPAGGPGMAGGDGAKPEAGMGQRAGEKAAPKDPAPPQGPGGMGGQPAEGGPQGKEQGEAPAGGNQPGMGVNRDPGNPGDVGNPGPQDVKPEEAAPAPPTELQLRKFRDAVTPDVLKDLRMTPEDFERFLKKYEEMAKRPEYAREVLPGSRPGVGLPALGGGNRPPATATGATPTTGPGTINRPQAPPGYDEAYAEFLRQLAKPERK